ncbi:UpxY family transcription antiterminator [Mucilaginibacter robiniae]|uniref:UpxY family transcription antiterminator n=1 Tax=Mucilaginibacter robiniae TaxID=2728022 RepID=A0A7L5DWQ8_9SPHI|nr:UpxY family transcription antiterminator [Mucilaginibacter robiniae]QJD94419.1 UpxY family transcription antiterminator [Mucilaginibacter robiniae]
MKTVDSTYKLKAIERRWMVVYTRSKWEKKVDRLLSDQGIASYCPVVKSQRKWADRTKIVEMPLFNSYVFVYATLQEQNTILQTPGVLNFVVHCNKPVLLENTEITRIHSIVKDYVDIETVNLNLLNVGNNVKINNGPLLNHYGKVVQLQGKSVLMVMEKLGCALIVKVPYDHVIGNTSTNLITAKA